MHRSLLTALLLPLAAGTMCEPAIGESRHDPVRIVTPSSSEAVLLTPTPERSGVQTVTRNSSAVTTAAVDQARSSLIIVRTREPLPPLAITAGQTVNEATHEEIRRAFPYVRRSDSVLSDLRSAQRTYLRGTGAILRVRTFGPNRDVQQDTSQAVPRGIVRRPPARVLPADG